MRQRGASGARNTRRNRLLRYFRSASAHALPASITSHAPKPRFAIPQNRRCAISNSTRCSAGTRLTRESKHGAVSDRWLAKAAVSLLVNATTCRIRRVQRAHFVVTFRPSRQSTNHIPGRAALRTSASAGSIACLFSRRENHGYGFVPERSKRGSRYHWDLLRRYSSHLPACGRFKKHRSPHQPSLRPSHRDRGRAPLVPCRFRRSCLCVGCFCNQSCAGSHGRRRVHRADAMAAPIAGAGEKPPRRFSRCLLSMISL